MVFEIIKEGNVVFTTEHKECIYPIKTLRAMSKTGYSFRLNGKRATVEKIISL